MSFLPPSTNDAFRGPRLAAWWLALAAVLTIVPALIHLTLPDGGAQSIARLDLGDRRALVVGVFRWEGASQLALGLAMLGVALRWRALVPLFLALNVLERGLMALYGWVLEPPAGGHHPPEHYGSVVATALSLTFLALCLRRRPA